MIRSSQSGLSYCHINYCTEWENIKRSLQRKQTKVIKFIKFSLIILLQHLFVAMNNVDKSTEGKKNLSLSDVMI
jgi:hypothetical protein